MPKFIKTDRVAVSDDAGNTVWVRRKMDLGAVSRVQFAAAGETLIALYGANILAWEGPDFKGVKCTPEAIATIDPDDPFWTKVADKIAELNPRKENADPLDGSASNGTTSGELAAASQTSETSM